MCDEYQHEYADKTCPECGRVFCYSCCRDQNVDQGGKYERDFMLCPQCGHDYYETEKHPCSLCGAPTREDVGSVTAQWYLCDACVGSEEAEHAGFCHY
jgi:ribosomal protein L37E